MSDHSPNQHRRGQVAMGMAALAWSIAPVLQRGLKVTVATQMAGRALFSTIALTALVLHEANQAKVSPITLFRSIGLGGLWVALSMGGASASFVYALNHGKAANVLFIQALTPFVAVLLAMFLLGERPTKRTGVAMVAAGIGVGIMVGGPKAGEFRGLAAAFLMTLLFSSAIVFLRKHPNVSMSPALALGQLFVFLGAFTVSDFSAALASDWWRFVVLGFVQMAIGNLCFSIGARLLPASEAAIITLLEVILGPLWVWFAYSENPGAQTLIGGGVVLAAVVYQALERASAPSEPASSQHTLRAHTKS